MIFEGVSSPAGKRKAEILDTDDFENVDPSHFAKRAKGSPKDGLKKPTNFILKTPIAPPSSAFTFESRLQDSLSPVKSSSTPRRTLQPKSQAARLQSKTPKSSPIFAPAGRSPPRGKKLGLLSSRRRTASPFTRVDPPSFSLGAAPFSLDAALKGTIPSYTSKTAAPSVLDDKAELKASWFFDIHEDTPEQEMTNLLQHSTCVLDISSDEESEQKAKQEKDEGRDKENVPPMDDVSQTSARRERLGEDSMVVEKERTALGEMNTADYYPAGCDETSVVFVPADEESEQAPKPLSPKEQTIAPPVEDFEFAPELKDVKESTSLIDVDIDTLMAKQEDGNSKAAVLQPIEGTGESFELWESGSDKGEAL